VFESKGDSNALAGPVLKNEKPANHAVPRPSRQGGKTLNEE